MAEVVEFDFESSLQPTVGQPDAPPPSMPATMRKNYKKTVCRYWLRNLCMKGNSCSFLHQYDPDKMPICRFFAKYGECKEIDCPYSHASEGIKDCNMYKLGFCIHGPNCLFRHVKKTSPPPPAEDAALLGRPGFRGPLFSNQLALRQQGQTSLRLQSNNEHTAFTGSQTATI
mmetsp:Transcript_22201/g.75397  ORF Transcript_22201/g.75397 Transcript_22201/m.75397 type:complete len:172 (-) Transcript_22201:950-1465(-)